MTERQQREMELRRKKAMAMRYKRPALAELGYEFLTQGLQEICEECDNVKYYIDSDDGSDGGLIASTDGDEELAEEFKLAFTMLSDDAQSLWDAVQSYNTDLDAETYNDCTCALIGNRYNMLGYDEMETDYYSLSRYESQLAETEAGERLMRRTKKDMISTIGQCVGVAMAYQDLRLRFDYLKAAMDVQMGINLDLLQDVNDINEAWKNEDWQKLERLAAELPERAWVE